METFYFTYVIFIVDLYMKYQTLKLTGNSLHNMFGTGHYKTSILSIHYRKSKRMEDVVEFMCVWLVSTTAVPRYFDFR